MGTEIIWNKKTILERKQLSISFYGHGHKRILHCIDVRLNNSLPFLLCQVRGIVLLTTHQELHTKIVPVRQHETLKELNNNLATFYDMKLNLKKKTVLDSWQRYAVERDLFIDDINIIVSFMIGLCNGTFIVIVVN